MSRIQQAVLLLVIATSCVGCDQVSKVYFKERCQRLGPRSYLFDTIRLEYAENTGAFLSLGANLQAWVFVAIGVVLVVGMLIYLFRLSKRELISTAIVALLVGGAIGNLIDRSLFGFVRDFANLGIGPVRTGIFNVADVAITSGVVVLFWLGMRRDDPVAKEEK